MVGRLTLVGGAGNRTGFDSLTLCQKTTASMQGVNGPRWAAGSKTQARVRIFAWGSSPPPSASLPEHLFCKRQILLTRCHRVSPSWRFKNQPPLITDLCNRISTRGKIHIALAQI